MDPNITAITLTKLNPGSIYAVQLAGSNSRGIGNFSLNVSQTTFRGIHSTIKHYITKLTAKHNSTTGFIAQFFK